MQEELCRKDYIKKVNELEIELNRRNLLLKIWKVCILRLKMILRIIFNNEVNSCLLWKSLMNLYDRMIN